MIELAGKVSEDALLALYRGASGLVYPSLYRRLRASASRGDGLRDSGHRLPCVVDSGGDWRCGRPAGSERRCRVGRGDRVTVRSRESGGPARGRPPPRGGLHLAARRRDHGRCLPTGAWRAGVSTPDVSVIVLNYNGRQWLKPCLDALAAQRGAPAFEVMVVDNASTDGSSAYVREHFPAVRVHDAGRNLGFSGGNNAGARQARGRLLVFLNNDTVVASDWLGRLVAALDGRPEFGFATSRIVFADEPGRIDSAGDGYLFAGGAFKRGYGQALRGFRRSARSVRRLRLRDGHEARTVRGARRIRSDPSSSSTRTSICRIARSCSGRDAGMPPMRSSTMPAARRWAARALARCSSGSAIWSGPG